MTTFPHYLTTLDYLPLKNSFFPAEVPSNKLIVVLHGRGGKSEDFSWIPETFDFDDMHYLLLDAPNTYEEGYSWCHDLQSMQNISKLLTKTFDILYAKDFDASQSFLIGFSQGALLTFEFGARYPKKMAGYIAMSGYLYNPEHILKETPATLKNANWLCTHGTKDEALDYHKTKEQIKILQKGGFTITFESFDKAHEITKEEITMIYQWIKKYSN
ncbi:MAG: serine esterase [Sulfurovum sp.]|nr:serine esterase [Sulfurovum sp.]